MDILPLHEHKTAQAVLFLVVPVQNAVLKMQFVMLPKNYPSRERISRRWLRHDGGKHSLTLPGSTGKELLRSFNYQLLIDFVLGSPLCLCHTIPTFKELSG